jgi:hypothetical protein
LDFHDATHAYFDTQRDDRWAPKKQIPINPNYDGDVAAVSKPC